MADAFGLRDASALFVDPPFDKALIGLARGEGLHLIAAQMPRQQQQQQGAKAAGGPARSLGAGRHAALPTQLLAVLRGAGVPLLLYPDRTPPLIRPTEEGFHVEVHRARVLAPTVGPSRPFTPPAY